jgi:hypothetical protein
MGERKAKRFSWPSWRGTSVGLWGLVRKEDSNKRIRPDHAFPGGRSSVCHWCGSLTGPISPQGLQAQLVFPDGTAFANPPLYTPRGTISARNDDGFRSFLLARMSR